MGRQVDALCALMEARGSVTREFGAGDDSSEDPDEREDCKAVAEALGPRRELRGGRGGGDDFS